VTPSARTTRLNERREAVQYDGRLLRYHVAFHLSQKLSGMVVAEALDFPGAVSQGFDLPAARLMIASAREDLAQLLLEERKPELIGYMRSHECLAL
jgi:hypothetical protein